jgi:uncharacterized lipoprotein YddW (UPF0748 family)
MELCNNYDIDAIHFDDYFYVLTGTTFNFQRNADNSIKTDANGDWLKVDSTLHSVSLKTFLGADGQTLDNATYHKYSDGKINPIPVDQWRRDNCTLLVQTIRNNINSYNANKPIDKPFIEFGISPGGQ